MQQLKQMNDSDTLDGEELGILIASRAAKLERGEGDADAHVRDIVELLAKSPLVYSVAKTIPGDGRVYLSSDVTGADGFMLFHADGAHYGADGEGFPADDLGILLESHARKLERGEGDAETHIRRIMTTLGRAAGVTAAEQTIDNHARVYVTTVLDGTDGVTLFHPDPDGDDE